MVKRQSKINLRKKDKMTRHRKIKKNKTKKNKKRRNIKFGGTEVYEFIKINPSNKINKII